MTPVTVNQDSPMNEEPLGNSSHDPSNLTDQIAENEGTGAGEGTIDQSADKSGEAQNTVLGVKTDVDPVEGTPNPASDGSSGPGPDPTSTPTDKPKHKSAFVKVTELDEEEMPLAWIEAFTREFPDTEKRSPYLGSDITSLSGNGELLSIHHYFLFEQSGGNIQEGVSPYMVICLEEQRGECCTWIFRLGWPVETSGSASIPFCRRH